MDILEKHLHKSDYKRLCMRFSTVCLCLGKRLLHIPYLMLRKGCYRPQTTISMTSLQCIMLITNKTAFFSLIWLQGKKKDPGRLIFCINSQNSSQKSLLTRILPFLTAFPSLLQSELTEVIYFRRGHLSKFCHISSSSSI